MNLILIGMPACGKSTAGVVLAKATGMAFLDTDLLIQEKEGKLLQQVIDEEGMEGFLKLEEDTLLSIETDHTVIATGGSAIYSKDGMEHLKTSGIAVYLQTPLELIEKRLYNIHSRGIAMRDGETIKDLYHRRVILYETYADYIVNVERLSVEETIEEIITLLGK